MAKSRKPSTEAEVFDVLIVGAGLYGINCAYRLKTELPAVKFADLEGRDRIGGTWDVYRSPGVRSDSDSLDRPIGKADEIMEYMTDEVSKHRLDCFIRFSHKVLFTRWSTADQSWTLVVRARHDISKRFGARWIILGTGYFDYNSASQPDILGQVISPQIWPRDFDYSNKRIALIGSDWLTLLFCRYFPGVTKDVFCKNTIKLAPKSIDYDTHLKPRYDPRDQRICTDPDGVFHKALHRPNVHLVTGEIEKVTGNRVNIRSGQSAGADIIEKIQLQVDDKPAMLDGVPNMMFMRGFILIRLWKSMHQNTLAAATPKIPQDAAAGTQRMWDLDATYVREAVDRLPVYGAMGRL
ncbi:putative flavin-binding monooxygenase [Hypoxylon sp. FL1150]|nr:putative flavin-binding monooxygenase [Hypoxylon sp. FL1150]